MSFTLYDASITVAKDALQSLTDILKVAEASPQAATLLAARIHENMLPLSFQISSVTDIAQKLVARTSGTEPLTLEGKAETFESAFARIAVVQDVLEKADKDLINGRVGEIVTLGLGPGKSAQMPSGSYALAYTLPNLFFHLVTAYDILRKEGVELGKKHYQTAFMGKYLAKAE